MPKWVYSEVDKISFEFIWRGKDRIKRTTLFQDYKDGGLKVLNFELFVKAQRVMWIKRLLYGEKDMGWKVCFDYMFRSVGGRLIFSCNFDAHKIALKAPPFYMHCLSAWQDLDRCKNCGENNKDPIFFNNKIVCINGQMVFHESLYLKDIYKLSHIVDDKGRVRPLSYFKSLGISLIDIVKIYELYKVMPRCWKNVNSDGQQHDDDSDISLQLFGKREIFTDVCSRKVYRYFVEALQKEYKLKIKYLSDNLDLNKKEIGEIFFRPRFSTLIPKLREFQFKLLHGALYTKEKLFQFALAADTLCSFCHQDTETYLHIFFNCIKVKLLWQEVIQTFDLREVKKMNWKDFLFGAAGNSSRIRCINSIF